MAFGLRSIGQGLEVVAGLNVDEEENTRELSPQERWARQLEETHRNIEPYWERRLPPVERDIEDAARPESGERASNRSSADFDVDHVSVPLARQDSSTENLQLEDESPNESDPTILQETIERQKNQIRALEASLEHEMQTSCRFEDQRNAAQEAATQAYLDGRIDEGRGLEDRMQGLTRLLRASAENEASLRVQLKAGQQRECTLSTQLHEAQLANDRLAALARRPPLPSTPQFENAERTPTQSSPPSRANAQTSARVVKTDGRRISKPRGMSCSEAALPLPFW